MTNTNHKIDDLWRTILGSDDDSRTNSDCDDEDDNWVSKEGADAMSAASCGGPPPAKQKINSHSMNRDAALAVWERIAQGQFDYEAQLFIQTVARSMVKIENATEDDGVTDENRTELLGRATGLIGTRDKYKKLRDPLAIYEFLPSDTSDAEKLKRRSKIQFLQSDEGVALLRGVVLLRSAGYENLEALLKEAPSTKNITPWSALLRQIEGRRKGTQHTGKVAGI